VGVGIGIKSDFSWLAGSGIKIDKAIITNEYLETNLPDVYAAGDCAQFFDVLYKRNHTLGSWANATAQGMTVGKTMTGARTVFETASAYTANIYIGPEASSVGYISFIGVTDESYADDSVIRGSAEKNEVTRILIKTIDGVMRIVGATVINDRDVIAPLTMAVKNKVDISSYKDQFANASFDLNKINSG